MPDAEAEAAQPAVQELPASPSEPDGYSLMAALRETMSPSAVAEPVAESLKDGEPADEPDESLSTDAESDTDDESDDDEDAPADEVKSEESPDPDEPQLSRRKQREQERIAELEEAKQAGREEAARAKRAEDDLARVNADRDKIAAEVAEILGDDAEFERLKNTPSTDPSYYENRDRLDAMIDAREKYGVFRNQARTEGFVSLVQEVFAAADLPGVDPEFLRKPATSMTDIVKHFHASGAIATEAKYKAQLDSQKSTYEEKIAQLEADIKALRPLRAAARPSAERGGHSASSAPPGADVYDTTRSYDSQLKEALSGRR